MNLYHVFTGKSNAEYEVVEKLKPPNLLISYFYFKCKSLKEFIERIGYTPKIILDSGAYSAWRYGKNISPIDFMNYIKQNQEEVDFSYISLDVIGDPLLSVIYYKIMKLKGFSPIPVYHFGEDIQILNYYLKNGNDYIALGNTVPITNKEIVVNWINELKEKYPMIKFHLLGSSSKKITDCENLFSCDSSTWILQAINGCPKHILGNSTEAKIERAIYNMREELKKMFLKKLEAVKERSGMNIKSGRVMMEVKDRDWLFSSIENLSARIEELEKEMENLQKREQ